ncbi:MAG TPA: patatin-like phospholipase family protein, partial [Gammaproteobacteria bacterium]|nr:patatin-like phospholipase family protein [Gammaproteobacteria bacterium]
MTAAAAPAEDAERPLMPMAGASPKVCLVLSGGGARGGAHVGVLKVLEELHIPIDCIVGTSAGATIGGLYASGMAPDEIGRFLRKMNWEKALRDGPTRIDMPFRQKRDDSNYLLRLELGYGDGRFYLPQGFIAGRNLGFVLKSELLHVADVQDFDNLPIPFRAIATNIETGDMVVLEEGDLATALRASMAVPGVFAPVEVDGKLLVDGGLVRNLGIDVARNMGADVVIAVNVASPLLNRESLHNVVGLSVQVINVLTRQNVEESLDKLNARDVLITPPLRTVEATDFEEVEIAIASGAMATRRNADELTRYSVPSVRYWQFLTKQRSIQRTLPVIDFIEVRNNNAVSARRILSQLETQTGERLKLAVLERDLERIYEMGDFESVSFSVISQNGFNSLIIDVREKSWAQHYFQFGFQITEDFEGGGNYSLLFGYTRANLNPLGGEWKNQVQIGETRRVYSEFFQPLSYRGRFFIAPQLEYRSELIDLFVGNRRISQYRSKLARAILDIGWMAGNIGSVRLGVMYGEAISEPRIGALTLPDYESEIGGLRLLAEMDTRDSPHFPHHGLQVELLAESYRGDLNASQEYEKLTIDANMVKSFGNSSVVIGIEYGTSFGASLPLYNQFALGGFLSLSGYR